MEKIVERVIDGEVYKARFKGMAYAFGVENALNNRCSDYNLTETLFSDILVSPKVGLDDFEDMDAFERVRSFLLEVALGNFEAPLSKRKLQKQVNDEWSCWRLIYCGIGSFSYDAVFNQMTPLEIEKANVALNRAYREMNRKNK